jgi:hypothetical protein
MSGAAAGGPGADRRRASKRSVSVRGGTAQFGACATLRRPARDRGKPETNAACGHTQALRSFRGDLPTLDGNHTVRAAIATRG